MLGSALARLPAATARGAPAPTTLDMLEDAECGAATAQVADQELALRPQGGNVRCDGTILFFG